MRCLYGCLIVVGCLAGAMGFALTSANALQGASPGIPGLRKIDPALPLVKRFETSTMWASEWPYAPTFSPIDGVIKFSGNVYFDFDTSSRDAYEDPWTVEFLEKIIPEISRITGLSFLNMINLQGAEAAAILVKVDSKEALKEEVVSFGMDPRVAEDASGSVICNYWFADGNDGFLQFAYVFVKSDSPQKLRRHCILKNVYAALGMGVADHTPQTNPDEISGQPFSVLTTDDKILLRTLYDPRITTRMTGIEVLSIAKKLIPEFQAAVSEHGETALYQR